MKTRFKYAMISTGIKLPETVVWLLAIAVFVILLFGEGLYGQTLDEYKQDTVWLRSGEMITCKIDAKTTGTNTLTIMGRNSDGLIEMDQISKKKISRYKIYLSGEQEFMISHKIELKDGTVLKGNIISETELTMNLYLPDIGMLKVDKSKVQRIIPLDPSQKTMKSFWFQNPHATRLLFAPTAIPMKRGEGYYQNIYLVMNMFNYGVIDNLSIGGGFDFITMFYRNEEDWNPLLNFNLKSGFKVGERVHVGVGGLLLTMLGEFSAGIVYGLGTYGTYNSNITTGLGWGFVDGTFESKPFIMIGGMARLSEKLWFVSENWIIPMGTDNSYYFILSYGLRFAGRRMAVDLAFINNDDIAQGLIIGVPYVDFVIKLGK